jgi:hypothetical protein
MSKSRASRQRDAARIGRQLANGRPHNQNAPSESNLLTAVVSAVQAGLILALNCAAEWANASGEVKVELNADFVSARLEPHTLIGFVKAFQAGALPLNALLQAMADGELIPQAAVTHQTTKVAA